MNLTVLRKRWKASKTLFELCFFVLYRRGSSLNTLLETNVCCVNGIVMAENGKNVTFSQIGKTRKSEIKFFSQKLKSEKINKTPGYHRDFVKTFTIAFSESYVLYAFFSKVADFSQLEKIGLLLENSLNFAQKELCSGYIAIL